MKKLTFIGLAVILFTACEKLDLNPFEKKEVLCTTVNAENVQAEVKNAFSIKYPGAIVTTWFNKDNIGYTAVFTQNGIQTLSQFNNDGTFVKEFAGDDDDDSKKGCECELESED